MLEDSKEAIVNRMIRTASDLWGYPDSQDLNSFDPLVSMMFSTIADMLYKLTVDIRKSDARLVEKLYELVFSQHELTHSPAHAIIRANPQQARIQISGYNQFVYKLKIPKTIGNETLYESREIGFTPTVNCSLSKAYPCFLRIGNKLFSVKDRSKDLIAEAEGGGLQDSSRMYIGLSVDHLLDKLDGLSFMFGTPNTTAEKRLFHYLGGSCWRVNGVNLDFFQGVDHELADIDHSLQNMLRREYNASYRACKFINEYYRSRFFTVANNDYLLSGIKGAIGEGNPLHGDFSASVTDRIPADLLWLEIAFSHPIPYELVRDATIMTNCFPVMNRQLNEFSCSLTQGVNVLPLSTKDLFFDMDRVADSQGKLYSSLNDHNGSDEEGYMLRQGGVTRFDSRDAVEMIRNMIDLVRDERAGFSVLGADMIASELKQLDQIINRLQNRIEGNSDIREGGSYLLLRCKPDFERANIRYWSTNGEEANNIRLDSRLELQRGNDLDRNSIVFVTNSVGGRQKLSGEQKKNKLRRSLLSRGRIVTREDIRLVCLEEFGENLQKVDISLGKYIAPDPAKGFMQSIDVHLFLKKNAKLSDEEQMQKIDTLKVILSQESVNLLPYRVFIGK